MAMVKIETPSGACGNGFGKLCIWNGAQIEGERSEQQ
jgi:hypothetical protein